MIEAIFGFVVAVWAGIFGGGHATLAEVHASVPVESHLEVMGWIPYWQETAGTADALEHAEYFSVVSPFSYAVQADGSLLDEYGADSAVWKNFFQKVRRKQVLIIPTIMSGEGSALQTVLATPSLRAAHVRAIVDEVTEHDFDGIAIDYEAKADSVRADFSAFLQELRVALENKLLYCTIEPRISTIGTGADDYAVLNQVCDRVQVMAYDQRTIDQELNRATPGEAYVPVADVRWVEKVMRAAMKHIAKEKVMLGVPTYGHEYGVELLSEQRYERVGAINRNDALEEATLHAAAPVRNSAGEVSVSYTAATTAALYSIGTGPAIPGITPKTVLWWSDAEAIGQKVALARALGIAGIAIFKIDGGEDPNLWSVLDAHR